MNKIIEYMALGRPCVVFGLTENRATGADAIAYADDMTWQGLAGAIGRLLDDEPGRRRLGEKARERFERVLAWEYSAPQLLVAYERLWEKVAMGAGGPRPGDERQSSSGARLGAGKRAMSGLLAILSRDAETAARGRAGHAYLRHLRAVTAGECRAEGFWAAACGRPGSWSIAGADAPGERVRRRAPTGRWPWSAATSSTAPP